MLPSQATPGVAALFLRSSFAAYEPPYAKRNRAATHWVESGAVAAFPRGCKRPLASMRYLRERERESEREKDYAQRLMVMV